MGCNESKGTNESFEQKEISITTLKKNNILSVEEWRSMEIGDKLRINLH